MGVKDLIKLMKSEGFYQNNSMAIVKEQVLKVVEKYEQNEQLLQIVLNEVPKGVKQVLR